VIHDHVEDSARLSQACSRSRYYLNLCWAHFAAKVPERRWTAPAFQPVRNKLEQKNKESCVE
jgi:hypothetical protein